MRGPCFYLIIAYTALRWTIFFIFSSSRKYYAILALRFTIALIRSETSLPREKTKKIFRSYAYERRAESYLTGRAVLRFIRQDGLPTEGKRDRVPFPIIL